MQLGLSQQGAGFESVKLTIGGWVHFLTFKIKNRWMMGLGS